MGTKAKTPEITTGMWIGLGWGLVASILEGLPLVFDGALWPYLGQRLLALAYLLVLYGLFGSVIGAVLGCATLIGMRLSGWTTSRPVLAAGYTGFFAATSAAIVLIQRFRPSPLGYMAIVALAAGIGLGTAWLVHRVATTPNVRWRSYRIGLLAVYGLAFVSVLGVAGYRLWLRDLPLFNAPATGQTASGEQPNIVLITVAGLRPDFVGAYGHDLPATPNMDALAARGVRFDAVSAQAPWTEPSLASLLTSLYPSQLGITCRPGISCKPHVDEQRTLLSEALLAGGYHTQAYVSSRWLTSELGFDQGFLGFDGVRAAQPFDLAPMSGGTLGWLLGCDQDTGACRLLTAGHQLLFDPTISSDGDGALLNNRIGRFLGLHGAERFFLWVHYGEALPPYDSEPPVRPLPDQAPISSERTLSRMGYWALGTTFTAKEKLFPNDAGRLAALYEGEVYGVDRLVGELTGMLEAHGLVDSTLVALTSDHGQELMDHGGYTYGHTLYEEALKVPLILAGPHLEQPGHVVGVPVELLDLAPTLADLSGVAPLPEAEGESLLPMLRGHKREESPAFSESLYRVPYELKGLRLGDYRLTCRMDSDTCELYDLGVDPEEQNDLSEQAGDVVRLLRARLLDWVAYTAETAESLPRETPPVEYIPAYW